MPHIRCDDIGIDVLKKRAKGAKEIIQFIATSSNRDEALLAIEYKDERFFLLYKKVKNGALLKYDKATRPLNLTTLKESIEFCAQALSLDIIESNIENKKEKRSPLFASNYYKKIEDFIDFETSFDAVAVEVGFGSGRHILYQAKANPNKLFIGLEIHTPSASQLLKQIEIQGLKNIFVVNYDARLFLEILPSNICTHIYVHFPVPWDKKPHRRVISKDFLQESLRVLKKEGMLELRTDSQKYYEYAFEVFSVPYQCRFEVKKNHTLPIVSKYEARWLRQEKNIYDLTLFCDEESKEKKSHYSFSFCDLRYNKNMIQNVQKKPFVKDGYFFHFERFYKIEEDIFLIKCAFGDFAKPEQKYIMISEDKCTYYPYDPIGSNANISAHNAIKEFLNGECHSC
jgi:tRNA (guanine-N7-)-methyltransferase